MKNIWPDFLAKQTSRSDKTLLGNTLVRIVPDVSTVRIKKSGVWLSGDESQPRKTIHFCLNGPVTDHEQGSFNSKDGVFVGKVAILCEPKEMPPPAGATAADTWYRVGRSSTDGESLHLGRDVVIVAPEGMDIPAGVKVERYIGGIHERDECIRNVLLSKTTQFRHVGRIGWVEPDTNERMPFSIGPDYSCPAGEALLATLGHDCPRPTTGLFQFSADYEFENACLKLVGLKQMAEDGYVETPIMNQPIEPLIETYFRTVVAQIDRIKDEVGEQEWQRIGPTYSAFLPVVHRFCEELKEKLAENAMQDAFIENYSLGNCS